MYGPDRWNHHLRGQTSGVGVDALGRVTDEERSMEVSDADTDRLLSLADDEESEVTLSEDSDLSQDQVEVIRSEPATKSVSLTQSWPQSPQSSSSSANSVAGISPVVPIPDRPHRPIVSLPPIPRVCARPRLPNHLSNPFSQPSPPLFRPTRPPFPSELSRPALPLRATSPRPVRPLMSVQTRPFSTPGPKSFACRPFVYKKPKQTMPPPYPSHATSGSCLLNS